MMPVLDIAKAQDGVDQVPATPILDVNPGDVFNYLIRATNLFDYGVYLSVYDVLDGLVDYEAGTFSVNGASASDAYFSGDILAYPYADVVNPGETLTLEFDVRVEDMAPHSSIIDNVALITAYTDPFDQLSTFVTIETNPVKVRVEDSDYVIPEPTTVLLLGVGLLGLVALCRKVKR
jgi:hypothetical protein